MKRYLDLVEHYQDILNKRNEWAFRIQSTILMVSSTTFAVIASLSNLSNGNSCSKFLLFLSISLNTLSILFSCISIFENKVMTDKHVHICHNNIEKYIHDELKLDPLSLHQGTSRITFFVVCERLSYISFLLFIYYVSIIHHTQDFPLSNHCPCLYAFFIILLNLLLVASNACIKT